jgi:alpha-L-fucosidase 2
MRVLLSGLIFGLVSLIFQAIAQPPFNDDLKLWYTQPASKWLEALPVGNGSLGGMIFGGAEQEHIQFNEKSLITGTTQTVGFYQPFGDFYMDFPGLKAEKYTRELNLYEGIHHVSYTSEGINYRRECFSSYPDKVIVLHLGASKPGKISCKIRLTDAHQATIFVSGNKITATGKLAENQMEYESQLMVQNSGGNVVSGAAGIEVQGATEVILLLAAGTSFLNDYHNDFRGENPHTSLTKCLENASAKSYQRLRKKHVADYQELFNRVTLNLGTSPGQPIISRLNAYKKGAKDPALEALLFQ